MGTEIFKIEEQDGNKVVSARELHKFLEVKDVFAAWIKRMLDYGFIEGQDFFGFSQKTSGRPRKEYALNLECAKEISMLQRSDKGKQARQYFIEVEKRFKEQVKPVTLEEQLLMSATALVEQRKRIDSVEHQVKLIEAKTTTRPDYFTVAGYGNLNDIPVNLRMAAKVGQMVSNACKKQGLPIDKVPDPRFGKVNAYPTFILEQCFERITVH
jgi:phage anti-repressor protein